MKILMVNSVYGKHAVGGAEESLRLLSECLVEKGHQVVVVSLFDKKRLTVQPLGNLTLYYIPFKNIYWPFGKNRKENFFQKIIWHLLDIYNWRYTKILQSILDQERPDVVHTHNLAGFSAFVWKVFKNEGYKVVHSPHDYYALCHKSTCFKNNKNCDQLCFSCTLASCVKRKFAQAVSAVVPVSEFLLNKHLEDNFFEKVPVKKVIYNSIQQKSGSIDSKNQNDKLMVGFIGRIVGSKGVEVLLQACSHQDIRMNVELLIAGQGDDNYISSLKEKALNLNCRFLGFTQPAVFFPNIDVLVVPSLWHEPFGRIVVEAFSYGVPVIGARKGGIPELIESGKTGWLFDTTEELTALLKAILTNSYDLVAMGEQALKESKNYAQDKITEMHIDLYRAVIDAN